MNVLFIQHVIFEEPAGLRDWAVDNGHRCTVVMANQASLPAPSAFDAAILLGGPMGVGDEEKHPWLRHEKAWLESVIQAEKPLLGICLGAQLIAEALGGEVTQNPQREVGWMPVSTVGRTALNKSWPDQFTALHWHGDRFSIPPHGIRLAASEACDNQAFSLGNRIIGLQFHLEADTAAVKRLIENSPNDLRPGPCVQTKEEILAATRRSEHQARQLLNELLSAWIGNQ